MPLRLACPTLCALAVTAAWWANPSAHVNVTAIEVTPGETARATFVLPIDVR